jgi:hypothetical protein
MRFDEFGLAARLNNFLSRLAVIIQFRLECLPASGML